MMRSTMIWVALALATAATAYQMRPIELAPPTLEDTGEPLFEAFADPNAAASLEVKTWDKTEARLATFSVELKDGVWVIPSHNGYPADATERMGKAASSMFGLSKDVFRSDDPKDHPECGVMDPEDASAKDDAKGQRITIKDVSGSLLVDLIVGKDVPNKEGFKFARYPDKDRVYAVRVAPEISTVFTDWIEKDLLHVEKEGIVGIVSDSYTVDEKNGQVLNSAPIRFALRDQGDFDEQGKPNKVWSIVEGASVPAGKEFNETRVKQIVGSSARVKIMGVRPRPQMLTVDALIKKGFFPSKANGRLYGNEGEVQLICEDGVVYTLYFGEITYETGLALTAGQDHPAADPAAEDKSNAGRYMFVTVRYDPALDAQPGASAPDGRPRGPERAAGLAKRFDKWFYVIQNSSFTQMHKTADEFWKDKKAAKEPKPPAE